MCIIVVKPAGQRFPAWKTLKRCFEENPDGSGIMWNDNEGKVHIKKGFMTYAEFRKALKGVKQTITDDNAVVMHFRIKTHGEVSKECCHPFPLAGKLDMLRELECVSDFGIAHNGVITNMVTNNKKSDTMDYIINVLYPMYKLAGENWTSDKYVRNVIERTLGYSRLAIIDGTGDCTMIGSFIEDDGCFYSNSSYKEASYMGKNWGISGSIVKSNSSVANPYSYDWDDFDDESEDWSANKYWTDDDPWDDDYVSEEDINKFYDECPDEFVCFEHCPDYEACEDNRSWFCKNSDECYHYVMDYFAGENNVIERNYPMS